MRLTGKQIRQLRDRHEITREELAETLYGVKADRVKDWELGRRNCTPLATWAMVFHWDDYDLRNAADREDWVDNYAL